MAVKKQSCHLYCAIGTVLLLIVGLFVGSNYPIFKSASINLFNASTTTVAPQGEVTKLVAFVDSAAALVETEGENAFTQFRQQGGTFWQGDNYIFAYDMDGATLVLPPTPNIEGTNRWNIQDSNGVYFIQEMVNSLKNKESGWVSYSYPKPGAEIATPKLAYIKKVELGGKFIFVGSGMYY